MKFRLDLKLLSTWKHITYRRLHRGGFDQQVDGEIGELCLNGVQNEFIRMYQVDKRDRIQER
jgi:hypothetical protein